MPTRPIVIVTGQVSDSNRRLITAAAPTAEVHFVPKLAEAVDGLANVEAIAGTIKAADLAKAPNLKWVHSWAAGADNDLFPEMVTSPVLLTSSAGNGAIPLAEHSLLLMLMLNRDVPRWMRAQASKTWDRFTHPELNGLTVGIFGLGNSGSDLALKAQACHMRVLGLRRNPSREVPGVDHMFSLTGFHEFLSQSDFVVVTAPSTPETLGLFDEQAFQAMKPSAYFICISRGGIANDDALLKALREGWIAGAGLDAHGTEPLPQESPFWSLPNVIVTPHNGATTAATAQRGVEIFSDNLRRYAAGEPLRNVVDKLAGY
ncbi:MAG TPA: D-2-hydroxyacid dehydrogenase [Chloroflexota bacterium]|jgi:phosphoglycerate dehydrogenase-like enzyme|nr:D-2-hydroxyacid dehydrogenase [Chloroflexota bacterium]